MCDIFNRPAGPPSLTALSIGPGNNDVLRAPGISGTSYVRCERERAQIRHAASSY